MPCELFLYLMDIQCCQSLIDCTTGSACVSGILNQALLLVCSAGHLTKRRRSSGGVASEGDTSCRRGLHCHSCCTPCRNSGLLLCRTCSVLFISPTPLSGMDAPWILPGVNMLLLIAAIMQGLTCTISRFRAPSTSLLWWLKTCMLASPRSAWYLQSSHNVWV